MVLTMDISSAILKTYFIEGVPLSEYLAMLNNDKSFYRIKMETKNNGLIVQNKRTAGMTLIKCIKHYYISNGDNMSCEETLRHFKIEENEMSCLRCHRECSIVKRLKRV